MADPMAIQIAKQEYPRAKTYFKRGPYIGFLRKGKVEWWEVGKTGATLAHKSSRAWAISYGARQYYIDAY